jgi:diguanylate cyclase (GGDEF)-like protein
MMCDIYHFKSVNDSLGHAAGDNFPQAAHFVRSYNMVGRYGGEEFLAC